MGSSFASPPLTTPIAETQSDPRQNQPSISTFITRTWATWLYELSQKLQTSAQAVVSLDLPAQSASIPPSDVLPSPAGGLYRLSYRFRLTTAASVSSSLQLIFTATDNGVACSVATVPYTGNSVSDSISGALLLRSDSGVPITYETVYASVGGTAAVYSLSIVLEAL